MYTERREHYLKLEDARESKVLVYITGDRPGLETQIHEEVYELFVNHLDSIGVVERISLYLYTRGGATLAGWGLVNLVRQFCRQFEIIVPSKALSTGTLICLGGDRIVMTKQATLGPIDPSVITALNPQIPGGSPEARCPVSVEAIQGFMEISENHLGRWNKGAIAQMMAKLADAIHPLVLGEAFRSRTQIQMLATKLMSGHVKRRHIRKIVKFLCSESGSHDYAIHRREARDVLGLPIDKPDDELYVIIKRIYDDVADDLQLRIRYDPNSFLGDEPTRSYTFRRAIIESLNGGSDCLVSEGRLNKTQFSAPPGAPGLPGRLQQAITDARRFEGWRHENAASRPS